METAADMDQQYRANPTGVGTLHCIPLVLKDNFNTADMPTTAGNVSMKDSRPAADAFTVAKLRRAGALILGKANLQEFARGGMSNSSLGGQVLNPYDLTRTPGGSSGGTGASVAANLALAGTGSDTGQSIRSPSSCQQPRRRAPDARARQSQRSRPEQPDAGRSRSDRAHGDGCGAHPRRHGRIRSGRIRSPCSAAGASPRASRVCYAQTRSRVRASAR
jgi:hypothetical protein